MITVSRSKSDTKSLPDGIERMVSLNLENVKQGPAFLMHIILDYIVDQKFTAIESLEDELNKTEDAMIGEHSDFKPADLQYLRRDLLALRKSLFHEREILLKICRKDCHYIPEKAIYHYHDLYDHLTKFFELTETDREIVTSLIEINLSMLNIKTAKIANKTNVTLRRLTYITTIFMPLTLLAGIGGMSEWTMMTKPENWKLSYSLFILAMAVIGIANYYVLLRFEKKDKKI
ncbi:MAG: hypothetical protein HY958_00695 [Bacteroidia bacterium]|nr:hypothetical protein [Bacteroidia bacterium]